MKVILCLIFFTSICVSTFVSADSDRVPTNDDLRPCYSQGIDDFIDRCSAKVKLKDSSSSELRRDATCAFLKKTYFEENREKLIEEMKCREVGTKKHQIDYFLINSFYSVVKAH